MNAFTKLPLHVRIKYNLDYIDRVFEEFVVEEYRESGSCAGILGEMDNVMRYLRMAHLDWDNERYTHPFFTDFQVQAIKSTLEDGGHYYSEILTEKNEQEAFAKLRSSDCLLRCLAALGDEGIEREQAIAVLDQAMTQVREWQAANESECVKPC